MSSIWVNSSDEEASDEEEVANRALLLGKMEKKHSLTSNPSMVMRYPLLNSKKPITIFIESSLSFMQDLQSFKNKERIT